MVLERASAIARRPVSAKLMKAVERSKRNGRRQPARNVTAMGEIVDLDKYRRRRKRRAQEARAASRQRQGRSAAPTRDRTRPAVDTSPPTPDEPDSESSLDQEDRNSE